MARRQTWTIACRRACKQRVASWKSLAVDLENAIIEKKFRQDLYYRLNVVPIDIPPLRKHKSDIPDMVKHLQNGYLAENESATDLADGLEWLYLHQDKEAIQKEARRTILTKFSPPVIAEQHLSLYLKLLDDMPK